MIETSNQPSSNLMFLIFTIKARTLLTKKSAGRVGKLLNLLANHFESRKVVKLIPVTIKVYPISLFYAHFR